MVGGKNKSYCKKEIDNEETETNKTLVKIGNILLCLGERGSYYFTPEDFITFFEEAKNNNEKLEDFLYFKVDSLKEEEFFSLFIKERKHDIDEVKATISDRTESNIKKTTEDFENATNVDKKQGKDEK